MVQKEAPLTKHTSNVAEASVLSQLAERCANATKPDRDLDLDILKAIDPTQYSWCEEYAQTIIERAHANGLTDRDEACRRSAFDTCDYFTAKIDRALTVVPGYHKWIAGSEWAAVWPEDGRLANSVRYSTQHGAALAICAAALKARAAQLSTHPSVCGADAL